MIRIEIDKKYNDFIETYSSKLDLGGFSNLSKSDLAKSSRKDFQKTGLIAEISWMCYRYGSADTLQSSIDKKLSHYYSTGKGDGGKDDVITYKNHTRLVDVKASYVENEDRIKFLNLVIPQREMHPNSIYVAAFTVGKSRTDIDYVVLAGWVFNEDVKNRWTVDNSKFAVKTIDLRDMKELDKYIR